MRLEHEFAVPVPVDEAWRVLLDIERVAPCLPGATVERVEGDTVSGSVKVKVGPVTVTYRGTAKFEEKDEAGHRVVLAGAGKETRGAGTARATVTGTLTERHDGGDPGTRVSVVTDLTVTGRPAQFGRGVLAEVGGKLIGQFAACLSERLAADERTADTTAGGADAAGAGATASGEAAGGEAEAAAAGGTPGAAGGPGTTQVTGGPDTPTGDGPGSPDGQPAVTATAPGTTAVRTEPTVPAAAAEPIDLLEAAGLPVLKRVAAGLGVLVGLALAVRLLRRRSGGG
jgi:uncharacterized protein